MGFLAYLAICVFWGLSSIATKLGLSGIEPFTFSFLRFFITGIILLIYNLAKHKSILLSRKDFRVITISSSSMYFLNSVFMMFATKRLDAGIVPILFALVPVVMVVLETILQRKMLVALAGIIGIIGGIIGIVIVSIGDAVSGPIDIWGLILMGFGVLSWAGGSIYLKNKKIATSVSVLLMYQTLVPLAFYTVLIIFNGGPDIFDGNVFSIGGVLYMAIVDTLIGSACYIFLLKIWNVSVVSTYAYINPVVALIGSYFILGESITIQKFVGMIVILFAVFLIQKDSANRAKLAKA